MALTQVQFFFHLDQNKKIIVEAEDALLFFAANNEESHKERPYMGVLQQRNNYPEYYSFDRQRLEEMIKNNEYILEKAQVGEITTIDLSESTYHRWKIEISNWFRKLLGGK